MRLLLLWLFCESGFWYLSTSTNQEVKSGYTDDFRFNLNSEDDRTLNLYEFRKGCPQIYTVPDTVEIDGEKYTITSMRLHGDYRYDHVIPGHLTLCASLHSIDKDYYDVEDPWVKWAISSLNFANSQIDTIHSKCFEDTPWLEELTLSPHTKVIEDKAFHDTGLYRINFAEGLECIGNNAFVGGGQVEVYDGDRIELAYETNHCKLNEIVLPKSLKYLGVSNFTGCDKAELLILSPSLEIIKKRCFNQCIKLSRIVIPNNVRKIESGAFYCTTIGTTDFPVYAKINSIVLGKNLTEIEESTFGDLPNLKHIYCYNSNPPTFRFEKVNPNAIIHVPPGSLSKYKENLQWGNYFTNFEELPKVVFNLYSIHSDNDVSGRSYKLYMKLGESVKLDFTFANFTNDKMNQGWEIIDAFGNITNNITIKNDVATPHEEGRYSVRPTMTDSKGNTYVSDEYFNIRVFGQIEGYNDVPLAPDEDFYSSDIYGNSESVYNLQGIKIGETINGLSPGIYIVYQGNKHQKILIR